MKQHVRFISTYLDVSDYGVYVRRLGRDIRVHRDRLSGNLICGSGEVTPEEREECVAATRAYLAQEHEKFLAWEAKQVA